VERASRLRVRFLNLPFTFTLSIDEDGKVQRQCEVVWTAARYVGVKFV
jgi:hypothetical protein